MKVKEESEKAGLKLNIQKIKILASSPITSWQIDGGNVETVVDFASLGSKVTVDGDCNHKIKRHAHWKKSHDRPRQSIKKQIHHFADKALSSESCCFSSSRGQTWKLNHKEG